MIEFKLNKNSNKPIEDDYTVWQKCGLISILIFVKTRQLKI